MSYKKLDSKPNFPEIEEEVQKFWEDNKIFEKSLENREGNETFVFFEGPPTANAAPALHHVLARAFKDVVCRFQTMQGKYVYRKAGWDTHGLPVELQIEKKLGISGKKEIENIVEGKTFESIAKFNELCRDDVWQFKEEWERMTKRMGYWIDLSDPYITYEPEYIESVWWLIKQMREKDLIYLGHKVVPYCPRCGTPLSSHEVAQGYEEVTEPSVYVKFKLNSGQNISKFETTDKTYILSWTTTPWTLPGNLALAVGDKINYNILVNNKTGEQYIVAADLQDQVLEGENLEEIAQITGKDLVGLSYEPLFKGAIPEDKLNEKAFQVYSAEFVTTEEGTGVVHTSVMYGEEDYELGEEVGLPKFHTVDESGFFVESVPEVGGQFVKKKETEKKIFEILDSKGYLLRIQDFSHTYPFCWRCKTALLYYARKSWYIRMSDLRDDLIKNNEEVKWEPEHIKEGRFGEWLREVKDWAISRERYWGTPLPFWKCEECEEIRVVSSLDELSKADVDPHRPYIDTVIFGCEKCGGEQRRVPEVLDVWFDSGSMLYAQWHYPFENKEKIDSKMLGLGNNKKQFPADYICEGIDQTRGWFYTLLAISTALGRGPAYKQAISLGHILDENGQKMSKSKGNIVDPWEVFAEFGADAIRWYFFSVNQPGESKLFKKDDVAVVQRKVFNITANIYNYFATYADAEGWSYDPQKSPKVTENSDNILDKWINTRLQQVINTVTRNTEDLNVFRAVRSIEDFVNDLSTWYVRRSRGREDDAFFATLYRNLIWLSKLMAPFSPFFAEYLYTNLRHENYAKSVHLADWPEPQDLTKEEQELLSQMEEVRKAAEMGNAIRKEEGIKVRQPLGAVYVVKKEEEVQWPDELREVLLEELNIKEIKKTDSMIWKKENDLQVDIDLHLTPELKFEGDVRELERAVQSLRRKAGLNVGDPAKLYYEIPVEQDKYLENLDKERLSIAEAVNERKEELDSQKEIEISTGTAWLGLEGV